MCRPKNYVPIVAIQLTGNADQQDWKTSITVATLLHRVLQGAVSAALAK